MYNFCGLEQHIMVEISGKKWHFGDRVIVQTDLYLQPEIVVFKAVTWLFVDVVDPFWGRTYSRSHKAAGSSSAWQE